jgi:hypothetical protein
MSINEITLDPAQLPDWYGNQLVSTTRVLAPAVQKPKPTLLGSFEKRILILVDAPDHAFIPDNDLNLLTGILSACKLSMADIGILNLQTDPEWSAGFLAEALEPLAWWLFGTDSLILGTGNTGQAGLISSLQGSPVFAAPSLDLLAERPEAKRSLWGALKKQYGV